jgi:cold shock CspA family protein/ribosome-associated translation inhibitor RaiA
MLLTDDIHIQAHHMAVKSAWTLQLERAASALQSKLDRPVLRVRLDVAAVPHRPDQVEVKLAVSLPQQTGVAKVVGEDVALLIAEAADKLERQLTSLADRHGPRARYHRSAVYHGTVTRVLYNDGYGFLHSASFDEPVYFHGRALHGATLGRVREGDTVRFGVEDGDKGLQASWVRIHRR